MYTLHTQPQIILKFDNPKYWKDQGPLVTTPKGSTVFWHEHKKT